MKRKSKEHMKPEDLIKIMDQAEGLKNFTRHSWTSTGRKESVAEHCWRLTLMAFFVKDEFPEVNMERVIKMCMFHDMGEAFLGDIPSFEKVENDEVLEKKSVTDWVKSLPAFYQTEVALLFEEMNAGKTEEAKLLWALDKMECLIQHNEADISTWLPLEHELNVTYGKEEVAFSKYLQTLRALINQMSKKKMEEK